MQVYNGGPSCSGCPGLVPASIVTDLGLVYWLVLDDHHQDDYLVSIVSRVVMHMTDIRILK